MGPIVPNLCTRATAPPQLGPGLSGSLFRYVMGLNSGSRYGRSRHRQRVPSGSTLDLLCLARDRVPHRVLCPSQTAYCCLAGEEWACGECLTSDLRIRASVEQKVQAPCSLSLCLSFMPLTQFPRRPLPSSSDSRVLDTLTCRTSTKKHLLNQSSLNFDSKLQRIALRFLRRFISTISNIYLSFVDLVTAPRICELASRSAGQPLAR